VVLKYVREKGKNASLPTKGMQGDKSCSYCRVLSKKHSPCSISITELELIQVSGGWVFVLILIEVQILSPG